MYVKGRLPNHTFPANLRMPKIGVGYRIRGGSIGESRGTRIHIQIFMMVKVVGNIPSLHSYLDILKLEIFQTGLT